jgi:hypothetical protein
MRSEQTKIKCLNVLSGHLR